MLAPIKKFEETPELRIVWAEVYVPNIPDSDGDFMDAQGIQEMAYKFMKEMRLRQIDVQHTNDRVEGACVVESFIARKDDPDFIEGAWVVGVHIPDDVVWDKIKKGEINGFSMEALVKTKPAELELELPPVLSGLTEKAEDGHTHDFYVGYDPEGKFMGGQTTKAADGHYHLIRRGTATEVTNGHNHRFSYVEMMQGKEVQ